MFYGHKHNFKLEENVARPFLRGLGDNPTRAPIPGSNWAGGQSNVLANGNPVVIDPTILNPHANPNSIFSQVVADPFGDTPGPLFPGAAVGGVGGSGRPTGYIDAASGAYILGTPGTYTPRISPIAGTYLCPDGSIAAQGQPCKGDPFQPLTPQTPVVIMPVETQQRNAGAPILPSTTWFVPSGSGGSSSAFMPSAEMIQAEITTGSSRHPYHATSRLPRVPRVPKAKCRAGMMPDPNTGKCVSHFIQLSGLGAQKHRLVHAAHPALRKKPVAHTAPVNPLVAAALLALFLL
jgi:hypothetical protein